MRYFLVFEEGNLGLLHKISTTTKAFGQLGEAWLTRPLETATNASHDSRSKNCLIIAGTLYPSRMLQLLCLRDADK